MLLAVVAAFLLGAPSANAITFGQVDDGVNGVAHPNVGALFADWNPDVPGQDLLCTGTLISPTVFLTASHCTDFLPEVGVDPDEVFVTFDPDASDDDGAALPSTNLLPGTYHTHPDFGGGTDTHDIAVVVLDAPYTAAEPAQLPTANFLASKKSLRDQRFTAVGYGDVREIKQKGPNSFFFDGQRRFVTQGFNTLTKFWLKLNMNPSTGSGGTCFGDSGGPHFLGNSNLIVSITITGDSACRATDTTYRVDTASARAFLRQFVMLP
jgi:Trypsin